MDERFRLRDGDVFFHIEQGASTIIEWKIEKTDPNDPATEVSIKKAVFTSALNLTAGSVITPKGSNTATNGWSIKKV